MGRSLWFADPLMHEKYGMRRLPGFQASRLGWRFWGLMCISWIFYLVGGFNHLEKYWSVGSIIPNIWKKTCSKPPTRIRLSTIQSFCEISVKFYLGSFLYGKNSVCVQEWCIAPNSTHSKNSWQFSRYEFSCSPLTKCSTTKGSTRLASLHGRQIQVSFQKWAICPTIPT